MLKIVFVTTMVALLMSALLSSFGKTAELGGGAAVWAVLFGILFAAQPKVPSSLDIYGRVLLDKRIPNRGATIMPIGIKDGVPTELENGEFKFPGAVFEGGDVQFVLYIPGLGTGQSESYKPVQLTDTLKLSFVSSKLEDHTFLTIDLRTSDQRIYGPGASISFRGTTCHAVHEADNRYRIDKCEAATRTPRPGQRHTLEVVPAGGIACDFPLEGRVEAGQSVCLTTTCKACGATPIGDGEGGAAGSPTPGGEGGDGAGGTRPKPPIAGTGGTAGSTQPTACDASKNLYTVYAGRNIAAAIGPDGRSYEATLACSATNAPPTVTTASIDDVANGKLKALLLKRPCIDACGTFSIQGQY